MRSFLQASAYSLPVMIGNPPRLPAPIWAPDGRSANSTRQSGAIRRVLLVEDDWLISLDLEATLEAADLEVVGTAVTAGEAVNLALAHHPDLVVMDIRLQGDRDGIDAALEIYSETGIRSLFISANDDEETRNRALAANPVGWLSKPFRSAQLVSVIKKLA